MQNTNYIFREAQSREELLQLLRLRYEGYRNSRLKGFIQENKQGIYLDEYDCFARHFGLFEEKGGAPKPVGYMRVVEASVSPLAGSIRSIAKEYIENFSEMNIDEVRAPFPSMTYFPKSDIVSHYIASQQKLCEGSRFVIAKGHTNFRLSKFMFESAMAYTFFAAQLDGAIIGCSKGHSSFYRSFGFEKIPGTEVVSEIQDKFKSSAILLLLWRRSIPVKHWPKLSEMGNELYRKKEISLFRRERIFRSQIMNRPPIAKLPEPGFVKYA